MKIFNKKIKKLVSAIILIVVLFNTILSTKYSNVNATEAEEIDINISKKISNIFTYNGEKIENQYISYTKEGVEHPIYKLYIGEESTENKNCKLESSNENSSILWKALQYGYPYASLEDMGVESNDEAYSVTQEAIYCLLNLREKSKYESGNSKNKLAIYNIINNVNSNQKEYSTSVQLEETGGFYKENIKGNIYYTQRFSLDVDDSISGYNVNISDVPEGTKILDIYNNETSNFNTQCFKIAIPHKNIKEDLNCKINVEDLLLNTFPLKYGNINDNDYCVTLNKSEELDNVKYEFNKKVNLSTITAKVIFENGKEKPNAKIELKMVDKLISEGNTDENGKISFNELNPGRYSIYEKDINGEIIGDMPLVLDVLYNEEVNVNVLNELSSGTNIIIENEKKKGIIEIHVSDEENPSITIANSELEIYDVEDNLIETLTTDENGFVMSSRLPIEKIYRVKQKTTLEDYLIDLDLHRIEFKENDEVITLEIKNSIKKNFIKITKVDKDNNDIRLEGVVFGIYDSNNQLIEEIVTNNNGEAISSNLPINRAYYVKEIKALDNYVLDDKTITVYLTENIETQKNRLDENSKDIKEMQIDRLSSLNNCLILENQKVYNFLPKFGC